VLGNIFFGLALLDFPYCLLFSIFRWVHHVIAELLWSLKSCRIYKIVIILLGKLLSHHLWHPLLLIHYRVHEHWLILLRSDALLLICLLWLERNISWLCQSFTRQLHRSEHCIFKTESCLWEIWSWLFLKNIIKGKHWAVKVQTTFVKWRIEWVYPHYFFLQGVSSRCGIGTTEIRMISLIHSSWHWLIECLILLHIRALKGWHCKRLIHLIHGWLDSHVFKCDRIWWLIESINVRRWC
jgi:hypothetical protein